MKLYTVDLQATVRVLSVQQQHIHSYIDQIFFFFWFCFQTRVWFLDGILSLRHFSEMKTLCHSVCKLQHMICFNMGEQMVLQDKQRGALLL